MTTPIRPGAGLPQGNAAKAVGEAEAALFQRLSALFKTAAARLDGMALKTVEPSLTPEEALQLMSRLTAGTLDTARADRHGSDRGQLAMQGDAASAAVLKTLGGADGPLAGRALDQSVQQARSASAGPGAPSVPHPSADQGLAAIFAPFVRWFPRRKSWRKFKRWLERKLLKRDLDTFLGETYDITTEEQK